MIRTVSYLLRSLVLLMLAAGSAGSSRRRRSVPFRFLVETIELPSRPTLTSVPNYFTELIRVESFDTVHLSKPVDRGEFLKCTSILARRSQGESVRNPIWLGLFTRESGNRDALSWDELQSYSIISYEDEILVHRYFERSKEESSETFLEAVNLRRTLVGTASAISIRLLAYATWKHCLLPPVGAAYIFANAEVENLVYEPEPDPSLQEAMLLDPSHNAGAITLGLHGHSLREAYLDNDPGPTGCGDMGTCQWGGATDCVHDYKPPYDYCSDIGRPPDCSAAEVSTLQDDNLISSNIPIKFELLREFRDSFMCQSSTGKEYMGFHYFLSRHIRYDIPAAKDYIQSLPAVYEAIEILMDGSGRDNEVVVTDFVRQRVLRALSHNEDLPNPAAQSIVSRIEQDLDTAHGMTKAQVEAHFGL